jgi:coenzyme PQQ precursor peptide PqqA
VGAIGPGKDAQLLPGNLPKPSQAKCRFAADDKGAFNKGDMVPITKEKEMAWTTPTLVEVSVGLEINGYLPAEL